MKAQFSPYDEEPKILCKLNERIPTYMYHVSVRVGMNDAVIFRIHTNTLKQGGISHGKQVIGGSCLCC